jgi:hypothetical protein
MRFRPRAIFPDVEGSAQQLANNAERIRQGSSSPLTAAATAAVAFSGIPA